MENVGCLLEDSSMTHETHMSANADTVHVPSSPAHESSVVVNHEETIPMPGSQSHSSVSCSTTKCSKGSVCIEEYGCFTPHGQFVVSKHGGMGMPILLQTGVFVSHIIIINKDR
jgi:hypothetical protein